LSDSKCCSRTRCRFAFSSTRRFASLWLPDSKWVSRLLFLLVRGITQALHINWLDAIISGSPLNSWMRFSRLTLVEFFAFTLRRFAVRVFIFLSRSSVDFGASSSLSLSDSSSTSIDTDVVVAPREVEVCHKLQ